MDIILIIFTAHLGVEGSYQPLKSGLKQQHQERG